MTFLRYCRQPLAQILLPHANNSAAERRNKRATAVLRFAGLRIQEEKEEVLREVQAQRQALRFVSAAGLRLISTGFSHL